MSKFVIFFISIVFLLVLGGLSSVVARRTLSRESSDINTLTFGQKFSSYDKSYRVKGADGLVREVSELDINNYQNRSYEITFLPSQTSMDYSAGYFVGWEDIENSEDKYIILNDTYEGNSKYRIVFDWDVNAAEIPWSQTVFVFENVGPFGWNSNNSTPKEISHKKLNFGEAKSVLRFGDALVVVPSSVGQNRNDIDNNGIIVIEMLVARRIFGNLGVHFRLNIDAALSHLI